MVATLPNFVAIGASGSEGLQDIQGLLALMHKPVPAIIMVALHRPSDQLSRLRDVLARGCNISVVIAAEAERLKEGVCYIGEPDGHLALMDTHLAHLVPGSGHRLRGRSIDTLFVSVAAHAGSRTIGVVLSGALDDGSRGLAAIHAAGGLTMVLEPGHKPRGMQQNAIDFDGPVSEIGSSATIAAAINRALGPGG